MPPRRTGMHNNNTNYKKIAAQLLENSLPKLFKKNNTTKLLENSAPKLLKKSKPSYMKK